ncbi:hypothetical protein BKA69DRAFT_1035309 [Paraphysoderma sedebokerense]|nr:hypothetical protein BKA69DRAFT_1035309 [Paraphysoderma sedebokerense]
MDPKNLINDSGLRLSHTNGSLQAVLERRSEQVFAPDTYWDLSGNYLNAECLKEVHDFLKNEGGDRRHLGVLELSFNYINIAKLEKKLLHSLAESVELIVLIQNYLGYTYFSTEFYEWWNSLEGIEKKLVIMDDREAWAASDDVRSIIQENYRKYVERANIKGIVTANHISMPISYIELNCLVLSRYGASYITPTTSNEREEPMETPIEGGGQMPEYLKNTDIFMGTPMATETGLESRVNCLERLTISVMAK